MHAGPSADLVLEPLSPMGAIVHGVDLGRGRPSAAILTTLEHEAAMRGFLVFPNASLPHEMLLDVSRWFGSGMVAARHSVHEMAVHEDILRVSNYEAQGIFGVGPQWHHDGSFERRIFSHVLFHAQQMPSGGGGGTQFADLAAAYEALPARLQREWSRLATVNAYSGAVHPLIIRHPRTGRLSLCIHLGMVGAVVRWQEEPSAVDATAEEASSADARSAAFSLGDGCPTHSIASFRHLEAMDPAVAPDRRCGHEVLGERQVHELLRSINELLSRPAHSITWTYSARRRDTGDAACDGVGKGDDWVTSGMAAHHHTKGAGAGAGVGDLILVDNLAAAHRATPEAHERTGELRILHRTTVQSSWAADPPLESRLPPFAYIWGRQPHGLWQPADQFGVGVRWNASLPMRN